MLITDKEREALAQLAEFPLLQAVYGRRSRRFPVGGHVPGGPLAFRSRREPEPLSELERALLLATAGGVTGWHYAITHHARYVPAFPSYSGSASGRTFPSAAGFHTSQLFFTDDSGTYFFPTRDQPPQVEVRDGRVDFGEWVDATAAGFVRLSDQRLHIPREEPYMEGHNTWIANHPGSLLVIPVADLAEHMIANLAFFAANGYVVYDDVHDQQIPGVADFADVARVDEPIPLSFVEQYSLTEASAELATSTYNGVLLLQAMGLGGWMYDGLDRLTVLGASGDPEVPGLGFRYDTDPRWPMPNATGLPGVFETLSRPHVPDMAAAVARYTERKFGAGGPYHPDTPGAWSDSPGVRGAGRPHDPRFTELVTLQATYVDETFGKFPGTVPSVHVLMYLQAQHLDTDFYDTLFAPGAYLETHARHDATWH